MTAHSESPANAVAGVSGGGAGTTKQKPHLVFAAAAASGHTFPMIQIAAYLIKHGYEVSFVGGEQFANQLERAGVEEHFPIPDAMAGIDMAARETIPVGLPRLKYDLQTFFVGSIPGRHEALCSHLERLAERKPGRQLIFVLETYFLGADALFHGAPLPKGLDRLPRSVGINPLPVVYHSIDTGPFGPGLPPDSTASGRARNALLTQLFEGFLSDVNTDRQRILRELGATREPERWCFDDWATAFDATLQLCSPSFEYERSDLPPTIKYVGALPPKPLPADLAYPDWWAADVLSGAKKVVGVAQGTVAVNYANLIVPTIQALAGREDVVVIAILGVKGASLPEGVEVPANARVLDYFPYDAVLARADVFVQNAGYGGVMHAIVQGVPLVVAGRTEDKAEVSMRVAHSGIGVDLATDSPTPEQVREGVEEVLTNPRYKKRILEIKRENEEMDALSRIEAQIVELTE